MRIGPVEPLARWAELARETEEEKGLRHKAEDGKTPIQYGVRKTTEGAFEFFVDAETEKDIGKAYFDSGIAGVFSKELNRTRGLRPGAGRSQPGRQQEVPPSPEACRFYCLDRTKRDSLLIRPLIGTVEPSNLVGLSLSWNVYPNLFPFEPNGQFLIVPFGNGGALPHLPQFLTEDVTRDTITLCDNSSELVIFFNSLHAGATVNHFHLQAVHHGRKLAIEGSMLPERGRSRLAADYPLNGVVFGHDARNEIWPAIRSLQSRHVPFNLVYLKGAFVLVPRDDNNEIVREFSNVLASMELCGRFIFSDVKSFQAATEERIKVALGRIRLSYDDFDSQLPG